MSELEQALIVALDEMVRVNKCAFRVIVAEPKVVVDRFEQELRRAGIAPGFGVRAQEVLDKAHA